MTFESLKTEPAGKNSFLLAALCAEGFMAVRWGGWVTLDNRLFILSSHLLLPLRPVHTVTPTADDVIVMAGNQCGAVLHRSSDCRSGTTQRPLSATASKETHSPVLPDSAHHHQRT